ncbi:MAG: hypothetical protein KJ066_19420 [Acidobacteria bacterium]|nr:hypothetical protein [Acidobacteriota bacterium]
MPRLRLEGSPCVERVFVDDTEIPAVSRVAIEVLPDTAPVATVDVLALDGVEFSVGVDVVVRVLPPPGHEVRATPTAEGWTYRVHQIESRAS